MRSIFEQRMYNARHGIHQSEEEIRADLMAQINANAKSVPLSFAESTQQFMQQFMQEQDDENHKFWISRRKKQFPQPILDHYPLDLLLDVALLAYPNGEIEDKDAEFLIGVKDWCVANKTNPTELQQDWLNDIGRKLSFRYCWSFT